MTLNFSREQTEAEPPQARMVYISRKVAEGKEHFIEKAEAGMGQGRCAAVRCPESPSQTQVDMAHQTNASEGSEAKNLAGDRTGAGIARGDTEIFFLADQKAKFLLAPDSYLWMRMLWSWWP